MSGYECGDCDARPRTWDEADAHEAAIPGHLVFLEGCVPPTLITDKARS